MSADTLPCLRLGERRENQRYEVDVGSLLSVLAFISARPKNTLKSPDSGNGSNLVVGSCVAKAQYHRRRESLDLSLAERLPCPHGYVQFWIDLHVHSKYSVSSRRQYYSWGHGTIVAPRLAEGREPTRSTTLQPCVDISCACCPIVTLLHLGMPPKACQSSALGSIQCSVPCTSMDA